MNWIRNFGGTRTNAAALLLCGLAVHHEPSAAKTIDMPASYFLPQALKVVLPPMSGVTAVTDYDIRFTLTESGTVEFIDTSDVSNINHAQAIEEASTKWVFFPSLDPLSCAPRRRLAQTRITLHPTPSGEATATIAQPARYWAVNDLKLYSMADADGRVLRSVEAPTDAPE